MPQLKNSFSCSYIADVDGDGVASPGEERWYFNATETLITDGTAQEVRIAEEYTSQAALNARVLAYLEE